VTAPAGDPAYAALTWKLGYQGRQFGQGEDPGPRPPSVWAALAAPPAAMTTAVNKVFPPT
jgi:hypothetical protein